MREEEQKKEKLDEELMLKEQTFSNLQQEVDFKTKKLKKYFAKFQQLKQEIKDLSDTNFKEKQELEQTQTELLRDIKLRQLIIDNFIPNDEKEKLTTRLYFDPDEDMWKLKVLTKEKFVIYYSFLNSKESRNLKESFFLFSNFIVHTQNKNCKWPRDPSRRMV